MIDTHDATVQFGKHKGERVTRLPVGYLRWMVTSSCDGVVLLADGRKVVGRLAAAAEMERRGADRLDIDISMHAIDRLSAKCLGAYLANRKDGEGVATYLQRITAEAINLAEAEGLEPDEHGCLRYVHDGMTLVIDMALAVPVLKSTWPANNRPNKGSNKRQRRKARKQRMGE